MVTRPRRVFELPTVTSITANDYIMVEKNTGNSYTTSKISGQNLHKIKGPYEDDSEANTNSVSIGELYYTSTGTVRVRLT